MTAGRAWRAVALPLLLAGAAALLWSRPDVVTDGLDWVRAQGALAPVAD